MDRGRRQTRDEDLESVRVPATTRSGTSDDAPEDRAAARRQVALQLKSTVSAGQGALDRASTGVEGPGMAYPHRERIEQSFGRPISAEAHMGPAASQACDELSAEAFAMGDRVAFKSSPDLHTAAHEAAHTLQQAQGVQLKGGVGQAGDVYEKQADEAADRVVAGESAAHLFGPETGRAAAGDVVQRRDTKEESSVRTDAIRANLLNAQAWLDKGAALLREKGGADKDDWSAAFVTVDLVRPFFDEIISALLDEDAKLDKSKLAGPMDECSRALYDFLEGVFLSSDEKVSSGELTEDLAKTEQRIRKKLGLGDLPKRGRHKKATKKDDVYEAQAIGPTIKLARIEAEKAYEQLVGDGDRDAIVGTVSASLQDHLGHAIMLLNMHEGKNEAKTYGKDIEECSEVVHKIRRWISGRPANAELMSTFRRVMSKMNQVRGKVGLVPLSELDEPRMKDGEIDEEKAEHASLAEAEKNLYNALDRAFSGFKDGATRFLEFSRLKRPPPEPSFWEELAKGILISIVGNLAGPALGILVKGIAKQAGKKVGEATLEFIKGATTDSVEAIGGKIADGALAKAKSENQDVRDRTLFAHFLNELEAECVEETKNSVANRVKNGSVSESEIRAMTVDVNATKTQMADIAYRRCAHGFAQLVSREGLGEQTNAQGETVSNMDKYGGERKGAGHYAKMVGVKKGSTGVAKLEINLEDYGNEDGAAVMEMTKFEIFGMNDDMAIAVLENAGYEIEKLELPLEVHVSSPFGNHRGKPMFAVDEAGTIRHQENWHSMEPYTSRGTPRKKAYNADFYSTAAKFWAAIRHDSIPKGAAKITKGG
jgi:hypothetical protein